MNKVLFVVAHPDDVELAAGGTIKLFASSGIEVKVLTLTVSELTEEMRNCRIQAAEKAAKILGYDLLWYKDGKYDEVEDIRNHELVSAIDHLVKDFEPDAVFSHWQGDSHFAHRFTSNAVLASSRRWKSSLYAFPPNELKTSAFAQFTPNTYVDITPFMKDKMEAIKQYSYPGQKFKSLCTDTFTILNQSYGIMVNCKYAEAFMLVRQKAFTKIEVLKQDQQNDTQSNSSGFKPLPMR